MYARRLCPAALRPLREMTDMGTPWKPVQCQRHPGFPIWTQCPMCHRERAEEYARQDYAAARSRYRRAKQGDAIDGECEEVATERKLITGSSDGN